MTTGEFSVQQEYAEEMVMPSELAVTTITLGDNNIGTNGPAGLPDATVSRLKQINGSPNFAKKPSNRWLCVDGRFPEGVEASQDTNEADPQTAGGIVVSELASYYMGGLRQTPLSEQVVALTKAAINDDLQVTVHGDDSHGKDGCGALARLCNGEVFRYNAANIDIIAPYAWAVTDRLGINGLLEQDDVTAAVITGKQNADNDALWDASAAEVSDAIVAAGGEYIELHGEHQEKNIRIDLDEETAYDKTAAEIDQFAASLGVYKKVTFERAAKHGVSQRDAALQVMNVVLFNIGICKMLSAPEMEADLVGGIQPVDA